MVSQTYHFALVGLLASTIASAFAHSDSHSGMNHRLHRAEIDRRAEVSEGCFQIPAIVDIKGWAFELKDQFQTSNLCKQACAQKNKAAVAIAGTECYCGDLMPPLSMKVDDSKCDAKCPGYMMDICGSYKDYFSLFESGIKNGVENAQDEPEAEEAKKSSMSSTSTHTNTGTPTQTATAIQTVSTAGETTLITPTLNATTSMSTAVSISTTVSAGGANKLGAKGGVVCLLLGAILLV